MGEVTQLRGIDIIERDGIHATKISPEAGTTKTGRARTVPLHEHLIEQGFLAFVKANGDWPLFYNERKQPAAADDPTNPRKPRYVKTRENVATWVRSLGVNDPELSPTTLGGIRSRLWASAAASPKRCLTPLLDTRLLRSGAATASRRLRTKLKSFANFRGAEQHHTATEAARIAATSGLPALRRHAQVREK
jgi:hypothetical protein